MISDVLLLTAMLEIYTIKNPSHPCRVTLVSAKKTCIIKLERLVGRHGQCSLPSLYPSRRKDRRRRAGSFFNASCLYYTVSGYFLFYIAAMDLKSCWVTCAKLRA